MIFHATPKIIPALAISLALLLPADGTSQTMAVHKGITYSSSDQKLDLCRPTGERRKTALIFIHGGGFSSGKRKAMSGYCELLAKGGFTSVTISYRLTSDGHAYPAAFQDVESAIGWLRSNAGPLGIDPGKIVLIRYSAGGTLAMTAGLSESSGVAGIVSAAGITDLARSRATTTHTRLKQDIDAYLKGTPASKASPISLVSHDDPPVFLFHGKADKLVPISQSVEMAKRLKSSGVKVLFRAFDGAGHEIMLPNRHLESLLRDMTAFLVAIDRS